MATARRGSPLRPGSALGLSIAAHAALFLVLGFGAVALLGRLEAPDPATPVITLDFLDPAPAEPPRDALAPDDAAPRPTTALAPAPIAAPELPALGDPSLVVPGAEALGNREPPPVARRSSGATFAGLRAGNVRSVVFVVDASGSMLASLRTVIDELARSLSRLGPTQRFSIVFFQRGAAVPLPPDGGLRPATPEAIRAALAWARTEVRPSGGSDPVPALERALSLRPDAIFLLGTAVTGSGDFAISTEEILARLERANPIDPETGRRRVEIQCVQYLDPDPLGTLRKIADRHSGDYGYRFVSRESLGLGAIEEGPPG